MKKKKILFICTHNSARSQMAEGFLRKLYPEEYDVYSGGTEPSEVNPTAIKVMEEIGIDISAHEPITLSELHDTHFDLIVTLTPEAHHQALELTRTMAFDVEYWPTIDPSVVSGSREQILDAYRACRDDLFAKIRQRFSLGAGVAV